MRFVSADEIDHILSFPELIDAIDAAFRSDIETPIRAHHAIHRPQAAPATLLLMPAWTAASGGFIGTKIVSVFPDNPSKNKPSIVGLYLLFDGDSGEPLCMMDGPRLTVWRTAAASALAARYLARADATHMVMVGAGALAPFLIKAHKSVRPITRVSLWNHRSEKAVALAATLVEEGVEALAENGLADAVRQADIISCATMASTPIVHGDWLKAGSHVDLVGAYLPTMRESDDTTILRARLFCDTKAGAAKEGGDLADPLARGLIRLSDIQGDLFDLSRGKSVGRSSQSEITLFKSVGTAIEDLAAAMLVWRKLSR